MKNKKLTAIGLAVAMSISAAACSSTTEEVEEISRTAVEVQNPKTGELTVDTAYIGTVAPQEQVYVIPKTSGTVTETFFEVGDTVQEGDVLFKIDDEAARLQLANAKAAYSAAQAGTAAQSGGARDLQNYQTEEQIRQLKESLYDTNESLDDLNDDLDDVRETLGELEDSLPQAQAGLAQAESVYSSAKAGLEPQIAALQLSIAEAQKAINGNQQKIDSEDPDKANLEIENKKLQGEIAAWQGELATLNGQLEASKSAYESAQAAVTQIQSGISSATAGKAQLKSGIEQLEDGQETIVDNIAMAEHAYSITQNEIYPQTDAASAAQLGQVAVGIESAQMQLDFCTVTAPISGVVESVSVEKNGMAAAGNPAYIISNKESMTVTFHVAEKAKNFLAVGDHVIVEKDGTEYDGVITEIGTMTNPQTRLFQVKAAVTGAGVNDEDGKPALPNGVSVKVYAVTEREQGKLIVPYDAVYFSAGSAYVYCVENGTIVKTDVVTGLMNDTEAVIEEGLTEESQLVTNWSSKLRNGAEVEVVSINGEAVVTAEPAENAETPENAESADQTEEAE